MASNESIFEKLNLSSGEQRLVMIVIVVLMLALMWMVWGMIPSPSATKQEIAKAQTLLNSFQEEIKKTDDYHQRISTLEGLGSEVIKIERPVDNQEDRFTPESLPTRNGVPFLHLNGGKKSLCVDLKNPIGLEILHSLVKQADLALSFGAVTWPHMLMRGLLAEQIYRAQQILAGHPYHR